MASDSSPGVPSLSKLRMEAADEPTLSYEEMWARRQDLCGTEFGVPGMARASAGGAKCIDAGQLSEQATVVKHLLKSMGSNLMNGKSIIDISLPVVIFEPRSFLNRVCDIWAFAPTFLGKAARVKGDPIERMKLVVTFLVAGMHRAISQKKPFNPILGETSRARFEDGTQIYVEQPSHHPPITAFEVISEKGGWKLYGRHEYTASMRPPNSLLGGQVGPNTVEFADGAKITYEMPHLKISGIVYGERTVVYTDTLVFRDPASDLRCEVQLNPDAVSGLRGYFSSAATPADTVRGSLFMGEDEVSQLEGSWLSELKFDGKVYWRLGQVAPSVPLLLREESGEVLPSDARYRTDLQALVAGDLQRAEAEKKRLEEEQRRDRRLRKEMARANASPSSGSQPLSEAQRYSSSSSTSSTSSQPPPF